MGIRKKRAQRIERNLGSSYVAKVKHIAWTMSKLAIKTIS